MTGRLRLVRLVKVAKIAETWWTSEDAGKEQIIVSEFETMESNNTESDM